ncbi:MAG: ABC transporter permease [Fimbriimonadaceae bacterium]|nr:ABC transporter permease [Fimbriimonadaceae bacterium]
MNWADILTYAAPVGLAAQGETIVQRAGLINIGLEGTMLMAAYASMKLTAITGSPFAGMAAGLIVGVAVCLLSALFTVRLGADQVVVGTALNLGALGATSTMFQAEFGRSGQLLSVPALPDWLPGIDLGTSLLLLWPFVATWFLWRTGAGLVMRGSGEYPAAVEAAGASAIRSRIIAVSVGGALAGLAGAYLAVGIAGTFVENITAGRGFVAIAMVTFGRLKPWWVLAASLVVSVAEQAQFTMQGWGLGVSPQLFVALPYTVALLVLVFAGKGTRLPESLGRPFRRVT